MTDQTEEKGFSIEKAKSGRATCKKCKQKCDAGELRIAKHVPNYFSDSGSMKHWYHINCLFDAFKTQKTSTKKIDSVDDIDGWDKLTEDERDEILEKLYKDQVPSVKPPKNSELSKKRTPNKISDTGVNTANRPDSDDNLFQTFCNVCQKIANESGYNMKSEILHRFLIMGTNGKKFEGDIFLWFKLLLPMITRRIYNLQSKQLVKLFSRVFRTNQQEMLIDLEQGDVSETIRKYFEKSNNCKPKNYNNLTIQEVDKFLEQLSDLTKEDDQIEAFMAFCVKCNPDNLKMIIRLIKHDLKINAGPRHILDALNSQAYLVFQTSRDLITVITKFAPTIALNERFLSDTKERKSNSSVTGVQLMFPISPMLAEACKSVEKAIVKNPEGMFSEIKYDGERVQIHKSGNEFRFFTRNLKPVLDHKISRCTEFIPKAFPSGQDMILDSEIIVVNTETGELLPFGTLGVHKREEFVNSEVCLFVFDCIYYNGEDLTKRTLKERKKILGDNIKPIKNHVQLSEYYLIKTKKELATMTAKVLKAGLEGLVLKNVKSFYQPGKRGWLKIKKDYLFEGQMADTADLVVLGGWFGTGRKGGMLSIFLMGSYDKEKNIWKTVTKVSSGLDDTQMDKLQKQLNPLLERSNPDRLPKWISCKRQLVPDLIATNPINMPVWEITGAEFTKSEAHTANGISIRFPRITRIRDDKSPKNATNLQDLELLVENSKMNTNIEELFKDLSEDNSEKIEIQTKLFDGFIKNEEDLINCNDKTGLTEKDIVKSKKRKSDENEGFADNRKIKKDIETTSKTLSSITDNDEIFKSFIVYIQPDAVNNIDKLLKAFRNYGGIITENSKLANYVIHLHDQNKESNENIRKYYNCDCRHLTYKWLEDCIIYKKIIDKFQEYAVRL